MEEVLNNKEFVEVKLGIIKTIKNIYSQILNDIDDIVIEINSEKLTEHLAITIDFLKEIKEHQKSKILKNAIYN